MDRPSSTFARLLAAVGLTALAGFASGCESTRTTLGAAYMQTSFAGDLALSGAAATPLKQRRNSLRQSMRLDDAEPTPLIKASVERDRASFNLSGFWTHTAGSGPLAAPFGDLPAGSQVRNELTFANVKAVGRYDLIPSESFTFAPGIGVDYFHIDVESRRTTGVGFEQVENDVLVPIADLLVGVNLGGVEVSAEGAWMDADLGDADGTYWDLDGMLKVRPSEKFSLFAGYRWIKMDANGLADSRQYESNIEVSGWYVGGELTFGGKRRESSTGSRNLRTPTKRRLRRLN